MPWTSWLLLYLRTPLGEGVDGVDGVPGCGCAGFCGFGDLGASGLQAAFQQCSGPDLTVVDAADACLDAGELGEDLQPFAAG